MAWPNIDLRRAEVLKLLSYGVTFDKTVRLALAEKFACSEAATLADIKRFQAMRFTACAKTTHPPVRPL